MEADVRSENKRHPHREAGRWGGGAKGSFVPDPERWRRGGVVVSHHHYIAYIGRGGCGGGFFDDVVTVLAKAANVPEPTY